MANLPLEHWPWFLNQFEKVTQDTSRCGVYTCSPALDEKRVRREQFGIDLHEVVVPSEPAERGIPLYFHQADTTLVILN